jgi:hypothetical protein
VVSRARLISVVWSRSIQSILHHPNSLRQTNSVALIPQANYTDWATANCRRNLVPTFADRGVSRGQRGGSPTAVNLSFLDRSRYFFIQVAPHLFSQGLSGPRSRPTGIQKNLVAPVIEPETSGLAARNSHHYTTEAVLPLSILILSWILRPDLLSGLFLSGFQTKLLCAFLYSCIRATCPDGLILLD